MSFLKEFKEFAVRGNLTETAIAFVMGAAFGKVVSAFVEGMVMPLVSVCTGGVNFADKKWVLKEAVPEIKNAAATIPAAAEVSIKYGVFITNVIDFLVVALVVFLVIKAMNQLKRKEEVAIPVLPEISSTDLLLTEIRDALKK